MTTRLDPSLLARTDQLASAPAHDAHEGDAPRACTDRNFGLPTALHASFFGLFLAYLGVMAIGFPHPEMILPMAIFIIFVTAFYVVPMLWATMGPANPTRSMSLDQLLGQGMAVHTGWISGSGAIAQVMVMPVLILVWGIAVVIIAATV